jgi:hypothetical protein
MAGRWLDVNSAAEELGISTDAVRKRISRGSLASDRPDGNVLVWLDNGGTEAGHEDKVEGNEALVETLRDQVTYLREQLDIRTEELREHRRLLAGLIERVPELEAPVELPAPSQSREEAAQEPEGGEMGRAPPGLMVLRVRTAHRGPGGEDCSAELRRSLILRSSANRVSAKFALMEFSEVRVRQVSYSRLYEP